VSTLLLPGTEVEARGLRWEVVDAQSLGPQTVYRLRGLAAAVIGAEIDLLHPFESVEPVVHALQPNKAAPLRNWLVYHAGHRKHVPHYACLDHKRRGRSVCRNAVGLRQDVLNRAVLSAVADVLAPEVLAVAVDKAVAMLVDEDAGHDERREKIERELKQVQARIERLVSALADATLPADEIRPLLTAEKARKTALEDEHAQLDRVRSATRQDVDTIRGRLAVLAGDVKRLLLDPEADTGEIRGLLRPLLHEKIDLEPVGRGRQRGYRFRGMLTIGRMLDGMASAENTSASGGPNGIRPCVELRNRGVRAPCGVGRRGLETD